MYFSKKAILIAMASFLVGASASATTVHTKKLQVLIPSQTAIFAMNVADGNGFVNNPFALRPIGANYVLNGVILPGGTVSKSASNYLLDKHNQPSLDSSIGTWWCLGNVIETLDFPNYPTSIIPLLGQQVEFVSWNFLFSKQCCCKPNNLYSTGQTTIVQNSLGQISFQIIACLSVGTACNIDPDGNNYTATIFFDANFNQLIEFEFDKNIKYTK